MKNVEIKKFKENIFKIKRKKKDSLKTLASFLAWDIIDNSKYVLIWYHNPKKWSCPGEIFDTEIVGNEIKISTDSFDLPSLTISKDTFLHIIHEWDRIIKTEPKKIIITEENGKYSFDAEY